VVLGSAQTVVAILCCAGHSACCAWRDFSAHPQMDLRGMDGIRDVFGCDCLARPAHTPLLFRGGADWTTGTSFRQRFPEPNVGIRCAQLLDSARHLQTKIKTGARTAILNPRLVFPAGRTHSST